MNNETVNNLLLDIRKSIKNVLIKGLIESIFDSVVEDFILNSCRNICCAACKYEKKKKGFVSCKIKHSKRGKYICNGYEERS